MTCFREERDYLVFLALLVEISRQARCNLHAYCLMPNHFHLLATPELETSAAQMMSAVGQRYAHYFNRKYVRTGTLWEGRFRSCLVDCGSYLMACYRYIELNPVRAGIVNDPSRYPWSSCLGNIGLRSDPLLTPHPEFAAMDANSYARMLVDSLNDALVGEIRDSTSGGYPLGTADFRRKLEAEASRPLERRRPGRKKSVTVTDLFS